MTLHQISERALHPRDALAQLARLQTRSRGDGAARVGAAFAIGLGAAALLAVLGCSTIGTTAESAGDAAGDTAEAAGEAAGTAARGAGDVVHDAAEAAEDELD